MNVEKPTFEQLDQQRSRSLHILRQRETLFDRIGTGRINFESSWDNAIKAGRVRFNLQPKILKDIADLQASVDSIDSQFEQRASEYVELLGRRQSQLEEMTKLSEKGALPLNVLAKYQTEFDKLSSLPCNNPGLQIGLDKLGLAQKEEAKVTIQEEDLLTATLEQPARIEIKEETVEVVETSEFPQPEEKLTPDAIPELFPLIKRITSVNRHKYDQGITASTKLEEAQNIPDEYRTAEQKNLIADIAILSRFTNSVNYLDVYTPEEVHGLVERFQKMLENKRPEWDDGVFQMEGRIIDILEGERIRERVEREQLFDGIYKRAQKEHNNRRGMNWDSLTILSARASSVIAEGLSQSPERAAYRIEIKNPTPGKYPNLTEVFQFIADDNVYHILGKRSTEVDAANKTAYEENCRTISAWFNFIEPVLENLPKTPKFNELKIRLMDMYQSMQTRLIGNENTGFGKFYLIDRVGALNLQYAIAHNANDLRAEIAKLSETSEEKEIIPIETTNRDGEILGYTGEEITPLDP